MWSRLSEDELLLIATHIPVHKLPSYAASFGRGWSAAVIKAREQHTAKHWRGGPGFLQLYTGAGELYWKMDPMPPSIESGRWDAVDRDERLALNGCANDTLVSTAVLNQRLLARACIKGDVDVVCHHIAQHVPVDFLYEFETPLYYAAVRGHAGCVRALLSAGASLLSAHECNDSVFAVALWNGHLDVVKVLTEFGVPRWGPSFCLDTDRWDAEDEAKGELLDFLVATRRFNPRAGDPTVYMRLQAQQDVHLLLHGLGWQQLDSVESLRQLVLHKADAGEEVVREVALPALRMAGASERFARVHVNLDAKKEARRLIALLEEFSYDEYDSEPENDEETLAFGEDLTAWTHWPTVYGMWGLQRPSSWVLHFPNDRGVAYRQLTLMSLGWGEAVQ